MNLDTIPKKFQKDVIASFWSMLQALENNADNILDRQCVECYYRQWNAMTGDSKAPRWERKNA